MDAPNEANLFCNTEKMTGQRFSPQSADKRKNPETRMVSGFLIGGA
ncbi:MAG: hypothetical protein GX424_10705 [Clostridiales bacterium]|nr:hypothetical protein [Clostridiales bacterium]